MSISVQHLTKIYGEQRAVDDISFDVPAANSTGTVVVRAFYRWPLYVTGLGYNIANIGRNTANAKRLLTGLWAFHIEPS